MEKFGQSKTSIILKSIRYTRHPDDSSGRTVILTDKKKMERPIMNHSKLKTIRIMLCSFCQDKIESCLLFFLCHTAED